MSDPKEQLRNSLFRETSAFVQPIDQPYPVEIITPRVSQPTRSPSEQLKKVAMLIEDAIDTTTDDTLLPLLHEALEEASRHA